MNQRFWLYGYAGELQAIIARSARRAARRCPFAVALVRNDHGDALTPDLWAS
jgi:hypothetical protein